MKYVPGGSIYIPNRQCIQYIVWNIYLTLVLAILLFIFFLVIISVISLKYIQGNIIFHVSLCGVHIIFISINNLEFAQIILDQTSFISFSHGRLEGHCWYTVTLIKQSRFPCLSKCFGLTTISNNRKLWDQVGIWWHMLNIVPFCAIGLIHHDAFMYLTRLQWKIINHCNDGRWLRPRLNKVFNWLSHQIDFWFYSLSVHQNVTYFLTCFDTLLFRIVQYREVSNFASVIRTLWCNRSVWLRNEQVAKLAKPESRLYSPSTLAALDNWLNIHGRFRPLSRRIRLMESDFDWWQHNGGECVPKFRLYLKFWIWKSHILWPEILCLGPD